MTRLMQTAIRKTNEISMLDVESQSKLLNALETGGLILLPTDTIWGISCDATNPHAVEKIYALKNREREKPLIILVDSIERLSQYVDEVHPRIETLLRYHVRPLTVIYDKGVGLAPNLLGPSGSIGIRIVQDKFCQQVIAAFGKPIVSTSANISGEPFPRNFGEISSDILQGVNFVARIRQSEKELNAPSVIVKLGEDQELFFIRE